MKTPSPNSTHFDIFDILLKPPQPLTGLKGGGVCPLGGGGGVCLNTYLGRLPPNTYLGRPPHAKADPPPPWQIPPLSRLTPHQGRSPPVKADPPPRLTPHQGRPPPCQSRPPVKADPPAKSDPSSLKADPPANADPPPTNTDPSPPPAGGTQPTGMHTCIEHSDTITRWSEWCR